MDLPERLENALDTLEEAGFSSDNAQGRAYGVLTAFLLKATTQDLLRFAPILAQAIPELAPTLGFQQHSPHHAYDVFTHTAYVTGAVPAETALRWAALLHDIGKVPCFTRDETGRGHFGGHAQVSAQMASLVLERLICLQEADMRGKGTGEHENSDRYCRLRALLAQLVD